MASSKLFVKVNQSDLFVSEPDPRMFGNPNNEKLPCWTNGNWLKSRFHFSFAEYNNPARTQFGALRVMNDDLVQPARGFGTHSHRDAEIATYIVEGSLTHQDSMGTKETLGRGSVQFMTAGTGVSHSEFNLDREKPLRFIQMWFTPSRRGLQPNYGSMRGDQVNRKNQWALVVSSVEDTGNPAPIKLNQDINMFCTEMDQGTTTTIALKLGRKAYLLCVEGSVGVSGKHGEELLLQHEAAHLFGPNDLTFSADSPGAHCLFIDMAA
eukprot:CAMPEP_0118936394 /NCGR_PEP_ID=MMETSP1169-20130426/18693_1 /TAXON_ID=36882 /ORGANISM="Pyramimonas obovata, Strain CCMP722" /LENGTH=265 /DNA_ID=CAMNT_0006879635 /DNA_START=163 /DNA_END=960 /DNA_ORIENTATION=+